ncbi:MAG TPA: hypothetical protein VH062_21085 [Polyangiaceae bacterium]|jgi:hypothetical protein|nr:hypothetical protein [Polyangiaceae bacterium]
MQVGNRVGAVIAVFSALSVSGVARAEGTSPPEVTTRPPTTAPPTDESPTPAADQGAPIIRPGQPVVESPEGVPVWMTAEDGETALASVYPEWAKPGTVAPLFTCQLPCSLRMERGRYRIEVAETESTLRGNRPVTIEGPSRLVITPRDRSTRSVGLGLGIGGVVAIVAGTVMIIVDITNNLRVSCDGDFCDRQSSTGGLATAGLLLALGGAVVTPIGWVMFGKSFRPAIDVENGVQAAAPRGVLGVVGMPGGAGLGAKLTF